jgi:hypothetical protein
MSVQRMQRTFDHQRKQLSTALENLAQIDNVQVREIASEFLYDIGIRYSGHNLSEPWDVDDDEFFETLKAQFQSLVPQKEEGPPLAIRPFVMSQGKGEGQRPELQSLPSSEVGTADQPARAVSSGGQAPKPKPQPKDFGKATSSKRVREE